MSQKAKKQNASVYEQSLAQLGDRQMAFAQEFNPATDAVVAAAKRDESKMLRGRAATDAALAFAGDKGATVAAQTGSTRGLAEQNGLEQSARTEALGAASQKGMEIRDAAISNAGKLLLGQASDTTRGLRTAATTEFDRLAQKAQLANERRADNLGAATAIATTGVMLGANAYGRKTPGDGAVADARTKVAGERMDAAREDYFEGLGHNKAFTSDYRY